MDNRYNSINLGKVMVFRALLFCLGIIFLGQIAIAGQVSPVTASLLDNSGDEQQHLVSVNFNNESLPVVLHDLARKVNVGISYDTEKIPQKSITYQGKKKSVFTVLDAALEGTDLYITLSDNRKVIIIKQVSVQPLQKIQEVISGTVTDAESGETLPGVNVMVKGTTTGTSTDTDGTFELTVGSLQDTLVFSFIGYQTQEISIDGRTLIDVALQSQAIAGEELVVIGYGTQEMKDLTGSIDQLDTEAFQSQSMTQLSDMLAGTVAGFYSQQSTDAAGGSSMEIRGQQSLLASTEPLIVLDDVIYNGSLRDINPDDIKSIDVLKDASSAAIYGAKAASGVVMITTKKGTNTIPMINFSVKTGIAEAANHHKPLGPQEFLQFRGDYLRTDRGFDETPRHYYTNPDKLPNDVSLDEWLNYSNSPNSDPTQEYLNRHLLSETEKNQFLAGNPANWYDMVMGTGVRQDYNISISGGTDKSKYYWSTGYNDNEGIIRGDQFSAIRSRLNVDFEVANWFNVGINAQFTNRDESAVPASLSRTYRISPWGRAYNDDGTINLEPQELVTAEHPLMEVYGQDRERKVNTFFSSIYSEIKLPFDIEHRLSFQPRYSNLEDNNFYGDRHATGYRDHSDGFGSRRTETSYEWMLDNILVWNQEFRNHSFDITLLHSVEQLNTRSNILENQSFSPNQNLSFHALQFGSSPSIRNNDTRATGDALMARLNYQLLDKYLFTGSIRRDGYSAFGQNQPRAVFPAVAFGWRITEEDFFRTDLINDLKLRLSWGINGNRDIGFYSSLAQLSSVPYYDGSNYQVGTATSTMENPFLAWERTESYNIGFDISLLNNRVELNLDLYNSNTSDLLMERQVPRITGFQNITTNLGKINNRGIEATLNTININTEKVSWHTNFNLTINRNKIENLFGDIGEYTLLGENHNGELPDYTNEWFPGYAIDAVWNYDVIGIWQENEADEAAVYGLRPGDFKASDVNSDGSYVDVDDKKFIGHTDPRIRIGLRNDLSFLNNWNASLFLRADIGHIGNYGSALYGSSEFDRFSMSVPPVPYWTPENPTNDYARLNHFSNIGAYGGGIAIYKPRSFVRVQDVSLSYNIPLSIIERFQLRNMRLFTSVRNLYSFDNWPSFDPESGSNPMPRIYTFGFELSL